MDVENLHWVAGFVDLNSLFRSTDSPIVWTLHDMNPFTDGCHYSGGCERYTATCGTCWQLGSDREEDLSREIWMRKKRLFGSLDQKRLHIVTPSAWLAYEAQRSSLFARFATSVIPNSVDTDIFAPRNKQAARLSLGVPTECQVILFVDADTKSRRKGFSDLVQTLTQLDRTEIVLLLSVGKGKPIVRSDIPHVHLGVVNQEWALAIVYAAADLFVIPSREDNLPNTVLESFACGTPVIATWVGGIVDMVRGGSTGLTVRTGDTEGLAGSILHLLENNTERREMASRCRELAVSEYSLFVQAERYRELYSTLLDRKRG